MVNSNIYKNSVQTHEIDNLGHMNVQFYLKHCIDSCNLNFKLFNLISKKKNLHNELFFKKVNIRYLKEQKIGTPFTINFYISKIEDNKIYVFQEMQNLESQKISATFLIQFNYKKQSQELKNKIEKLITNHPEKFKTVPKYGEIKGLLNIKNLGLDHIKLQKNQKIFNSFCGLANNRNNLNSVLLDPSDYMGIVSASVPNLLQKSNHSIHKTDIGGAAVEYEFKFYEFIKSGTSIKVLSGLREIHDKTYIWSHWLINIENNQIMAIANAVIVTMNLISRKAVSIPEQMRSSLEKMLI